MDWDALRREARAIERRMESKLPELAVLNTSISAQMRPCDPEAVTDPENPSEETRHERALVLEIERDLSKLSDIIDKMGIKVETSGNTSQSAMLQRYRELYFDYNTEFKRTVASIQQKRASVRLFSRSTGQRLDDDDNETDVLLKERSVVDASRSLTDSIIGQAMAAKASLDRQRQQFTSSRGHVTGLTGTFSGIHSLMDQIRQKRIRNNTIIAFVIASLLCFTLWWVVLSHT